MSVLIGCDSTAPNNSNTVVNNNSRANANKIPATTANNSPTTQPDSNAGAKTVIKKFISDTEKGNVEAMNKAMSKQTMQANGDKFKLANNHYSTMIKKIAS